MTGPIVYLALAAAITLAALVGDRVRELRATVDLGDLLDGVVA